MLNFFCNFPASRHHMNPAYPPFSSPASYTPPIFLPGSRPLVPLYILGNIVRGTKGGEGLNNSIPIPFLCGSRLFVLFLCKNVTQFSQILRKFSQVSLEFPLPALSSPPLVPLPSPILSDSCPRAPPPPPHNLYDE